MVFEIRSQELYVTRWATENDVPDHSCVLSGKHMRRSVSNPGNVIRTVHSTSDVRLTCHCVRQTCASSYMIEKACVYGLRGRV